MTDKLPKSFKDLKIAELRRSAIEDFAVDVDEKATSDEVVAALAESGVTWENYLECHPEARPVEETTPNIITSQDVAPTNEEVLVAKEEVVVHQELKVGEQPFLIKMVRENPLFQTKGYTFTSEHPYQLVKPEDAQYILSNEDGFRQAFPAELAEFYG